MKRTIVVDPDTRAGRVLLENANLLSKNQKGITVMDYTPGSEPESHKIDKLLEVLRNWAANCRQQEKSIQKNRVKY